MDEYHIGDLEMRQQMMTHMMNNPDMMNMMMNDPDMMNMMMENNIVMRGNMMMGRHMM